MARGRPKGSLGNPTKRLLSARLEDIYGEGWNPVMKMAENAEVLQAMAQHSIDAVMANDNEEEDVKLRSRAKSDIKDVNETWDRISQYVQPKLKQVEMKADINAGIEMHHTVEVVKADGKDTDS